MISVGDRLPKATLHRKTEGGIEALDTTEFLGKGLVVLFGVPGAFTPTCSDYHLPGFVDSAADFKEKGVNVLACLSVNDAFVMDAWGKTRGAEGKVEMLADGNGDFAKALGLELDLTAKGLGKRVQRFAMVISNGVVTNLFVEEGGGFKVSGAEYVLENM
ncbi:MAG: peroxiredoxin [Rhodospirillum sp.]|nr:peroxiredoxin [Rhodospirillum sp.]MCF8490012.1 peroxiredoxin [Rhodospirillum sp.]MCF8498847.1 peroxiredoxin [Rhodospirillum sp.]